MDLKNKIEALTVLRNEAVKEIDSIYEKEIIKVLKREDKMEELEPVKDLLDLLQDQINKIEDYKKRVGVKCII